MRMGNSEELAEEDVKCTSTLRDGGRFHVEGTTEEVISKIRAYIQTLSDGDVNRHIDLSGFGMSNF